MKFQVKKPIVTENFDMKIDEDSLTKWIEVKYKNNKVWDCGYEGQENIKTENIEKIIKMDYNTYSEFNHMDCADGFMELKEGVFYFDWENRVFYVIKWDNVSENKKINIMRKMRSHFRYLNNCEKDEYEWNKQRNVVYV